MVAGLNGPDIKRISSTAAGLVDEYHLPGMSVGIVIGDELAFAEGFGYADIESGRRQDPALRQRIGSITKTMVGMCTMALVDEGRLSLDDLVVDRLPDITFHGPAETLAVRHLVTHTGGIGEAPTMANVTNPYDVLFTDDSDIPPISKAYPDGILIEATPGTKWCYGNHGFGLLGEIIARIEGSPIEEVLKSRIFDPLGMADTDCYDQPHPDLTTGYHRAPGIEELDLLEVLGKDPAVEDTVDGYNIRGSHPYVMPRAAGAVESTIPDMARYASALLHGGGGIVKPETLDLMTSPQWCPDERLGSLGITFQRQAHFGRRTFFHGGGVGGGWNTFFMVIPEENMAALVHMNLSSDLLGLVTSRIVQTALNAPPPSYPGEPLAPEILESAPGVYEVLPGHLTNHRPVTATGRVQITAENGGLFLRSRRGAWREGVKMVPADPADPMFFVLDTGELEPPFVVLSRDGSGLINGVRFDRLVYMARNEALQRWV